MQPDRRGGMRVETRAPGRPIRSSARRAAGIVNAMCHGAFRRAPVGFDDGATGQVRDTMSGTPVCTGRRTEVRRPGHAGVFVPGDDADRPRLVAVSAR
jgi:hypothetical protein